MQLWVQILHERQKATSQGLNGRGVMTQEPRVWMWDSEPHVTLAGTKKCHLPDYLHDYRGAHEILRSSTRFQSQSSSGTRDGESCASAAPALLEVRVLLRGSRTPQFPWCFAADNRLPAKASRRLRANAPAIQLGTMGNANQKPVHDFPFMGCLPYHSFSPVQGHSKVQTPL